MLRTRRAHSWGPSTTKIPRRLVRQNRLLLLRNFGETIVCTLGAMGPVRARFHGPGHPWNYSTLQGYVQTSPHTDGVDPGRLSPNRECLPTSSYNISPNADERRPLASSGGVSVTKKKQLVESPASIVMAVRAGLWLLLLQQRDMDSCWEGALREVASAGGFGSAHARCNCNGQTEG